MRILTAALGFLACGLAAAQAASPPPAPVMSCEANVRARTELVQEEQKIRLRIQAQPRPEGENVRAIRELIALMPQAYPGARAAQAIEQARKMDDSDAFIDADRVQPGKTATADQKALLAIRAKSDALDRQFDANPACHSKR